MRLRLLGPIAVDDRGTPLPLGATKQRAVLAMLALHANRTVPADRLVEGLWGEEPPASAAKMVQHYISQLRRVLERSAAEIVTHGRGYELRIDTGAVDVAQFEHLVDAAAEGSNGCAREALALWRGPPLADVADEPFAAAEIRRLGDLRLRAVELAVDADLAAGRHRAVIPELDALVGEHPLSEKLHAQRILALYRSGRQADALEAYRDARTTLVETAGIEPGPELRELQQAILRQEPSLDAPSAPRAAPPVETPEVRPRRARLPRVLAVAAAAVLAAALVAALVVSGDDGLERIDEDSVGRVDAGDGTIAEQYAVGRAPGAVAAGAGSVWVASDRDRTVTRIDPGRERVVTIDAGGEPAGLAFGGGALWVADGVSRRVIQIDPRVDRVVQSIELDNVPRAVAAGFGAVWVATAADGAVTRIDLRRGAAGRPLRLGASPTALATGAGALWVASESDGTVARIEPRTGAVLRTTAVGGGPAAIAFGAGALWVANRDDDTVSRLDGRSGAVTDTVRVGRAPVAIAVDRDHVWVANGGDGTLSRIDPGSRRVDRTVGTDASPAGLAIADGSVWAAAGVRPATHRGGTLHVAPIGGGSRIALDPASPASYLESGWRLMSTVYDGLVTYRRAGGAAGAQLVPDLAETLPRPRDGGRTWVFTLRRGLRYSDGTPVRPRDVPASFERFLRAAGSEVPQILEGIVGAGACAQRPSRCDLSAGVVADDRARTVTIRLARPDAELLHKLAHPFAFIVPAAAGPARDEGVPPPGTGPYRVAEVRPDAARLVRNPRFRSWSRDARPPGYPSEIRYTNRTRSDADVQTADVVPGPERLRALTARYGGRLRIEPNSMVEYLFLNTERSPFDDVRARRAVNMAVDRERIVELRGGPEGSGATCRIIPPGLPGHRPQCPFPHDPGAARRLVARSGTRGARVSLWTFSEFTALTRYLASVLRDLGYRPAVREFPDAEAYFTSINSLGPRPDVGVGAWFADVLSPSNFIDPLFSCRRDVANYSRFCDRRLDALADRAAQARDPSDAAEQWDRVERRLAELAPAVPLANSRQYVLLSERAGNFQNHPLWGPLLDQVWVR